MIYTSYQRGQKLDILFSARPIQQVFDIVISRGYYNPYLRQHYYMASQVTETSEGQRRCFYMCNALRFAADDGLISEDECMLAQGEIEAYINTAKHHLSHVACSMKWVWDKCNLVCEPIDLIRLYRNWANRPSLRQRY